MKVVRHHILPSLVQLGFASCVRVCVAGIEGGGRSANDSGVPGAELEAVPARMGHEDGRASTARSSPEGAGARFHTARPVLLNPMMHCWLVCVLTWDPGPGRVLRLLPSPRVRVRVCCAGGLRRDASRGTLVPWAPLGSWPRCQVTVPSLSPRCPVPLGSLTGARAEPRAAAWATTAGERVGREGREGALRTKRNGAARSIAAGAGAGARRGAARRAAAGTVWRPRRARARGAWRVPGRLFGHTGRGPVRLPLLP